MPLSAQLPEDEVFNMTPMVDIVFNLLIFFLLSAAYLSEERRLDLSVPTVRGAAPATSAPRALVIEVKSSGEVSVDNQTYSLDGLEAFLVRARTNYPDQAVSIRGDHAARYQSIADILALCRRAGIRKIDVMVQEGK